MSKVTPVIFWLDWKQRKLKKSNVVSLKAYKGLAEVAVKSLCELLVALPHFNFHNNIIVLIVPLMNDMSKSVGCFCFSLTENPRPCDYFFPLKILLELLFIAKVGSIKYCLFKKIVWK